MGLPDSQHCVVGPDMEVPPGDSAPGTPAEPPGLNEPPPDTGEEPAFVVGWPATNNCNQCGKSRFIRVLRQFEK